MNEALSYDDLERQLDEVRRENHQLRKKAQTQRFNWRKFFAILCLVIGLVAVIPASVLIWANRTITDQQQYVNTVGPVIHEPTVQAAITQSATTSLYAHTNIQESVTNLLPDQAKPLAGPITTQVKNYINSTVAKIVASERFANLWVEVNRRAQSRFMQIAQSGNTSDTIDINRLYQFVSTQLSDTPLKPLLNKQLPPQVGQITIITIPALTKIPQFVAALSTLRWIFLGLSVALLLASIALAQDRRKIAVWIGVGWMAVTLIGLIIIRITRSLLLGQISDSTYKAAASDIWHALLTPYYLQTAILFLIGLIVALCGWVAGPAPLAVRWREAGVGSLAKLRTSLLPQAETSPVTEFLRQHHYAALWVLLIATLVTLLLLVPVTLLDLAVVFVCAAILWLILEFLVAPKPQGHAKQ